MVYHFENIGTMGVRELTEMNYCLGCVRILISLALELMLTVYATVNWLMGYMGILAPVVTLLMTVFSAVSPYLAVLRRTKRTKAFYQGQIPSLLVRFGPQIYLQTQDTAGTREYSQIKEVRSFKHSYCLVLINRQIIMLDRNGFIQGTFAEFKQFLRYQRPDLLIPE